MLNCSIIGLGYIGLPTATVLANNGIKVKGVDTNHNLVNSINASIPHIKEKGIEENLKKAIDSSNFQAFNTPQVSDVYIFAVPTPTKILNGYLPSADTSILENAFLSYLPFFKKNDLVIIESTSPVGTTEELASIFFNQSDFKKEDIHFVYCPERVIPGNMLEELEINDRVIGGLTPKATEMAINFYSKFCKGQLFQATAREAEFIKLAENSYRDLNIAFANELSMISKDLNLEIRKLISLANRHPRVNILNPGCGVGGHCIAVDPWFLASSSPHKTPLIQTARKVNKEKTNWVYEQISNEIKVLENSLGRKAKIGCFGISFKPDVDDIRESPALEIINKLLKKNLDVMINDPNINSHDKLKIHSIENIIKKCDLNIFLVRHKAYLAIKLNSLRVLDFCGIKS